MQCSQCDNMCATKGSFKIHLKLIHDKIKDMQCIQCDYVCATKGSLKNHIKQVHDKIKDMQCSLCDYVCVTKGNLKKHIKSIHERLLESKKMSLGEFTINTILKKFKVKLKFQYLRSEKDGLLRYDIGIKNKNNYLLIEFDGEQHF
jgi:hypothetical protein